MTPEPWRTPSSSVYRSSHSSGLNLSLRNSHTAAWRSWSRWAPRVIITVLRLPLLRPQQSNHISHLPPQSSLPSSHTGLLAESQTCQAWSLSIPSPWITLPPATQISNRNHSAETHTAFLQVFFLLPLRGNISTAMW